MLDNRFEFIIKNEGPPIDGGYIGNEVLFGMPPADVVARYAAAGERLYVVLYNLTHAPAPQPTTFARWLEWLRLKRPALHTGELSQFAARVSLRLGPNTPVRIIDERWWNFWTDFIDPRTGQPRHVLVEVGSPVLGDAPQDVGLILQG